MRASFNPFPRLRRRARAVLGPVLPALVVGWLGAAGPCVGMAASQPHADAATAGPPAARAAHDTAHVHGSALAAEQGGQPRDGAHANDGPKARAPAHGGAPDTDAPAGHSHGACPHCPGSAGATPGAHARCAALDDVAKREPLPAKLDLKLALPTTPAVALVPRDGTAAARRPDLYHRIFPPSVPLNLRHCVLIV